MGIVTQSRYGPWPALWNNLHTNNAIIAVVPILHCIVQALIQRLPITPIRGPSCLILYRCIKSECRSFLALLLSKA
jgi:hypothetical protein